MLRRHRHRPVTVGVGVPAPCPSSASGSGLRTLRSSNSPSTTSTRRQKRFGEKSRVPQLPRHLHPSWSFAGLEPEVFDRLRSVVSRTSFEISSCGFRATSLRSVQCPVSKSDASASSGSKVGGVVLRSTPCFGVIPPRTRSAISATVRASKVPFGGNVQHPSTYQPTKFERRTTWFTGPNARSKFGGTVVGLIGISTAV